MKAPTLTVREATVQDEALLLEWANDPVTRANALHAASIPAATHRIWLRQRLANREGCRLYVVESARGMPVGQVRFERSNNAWEIHYALAPRFRGRGLGLVLAVTFGHADMLHPREGRPLARVGVCAWAASCPLRLTEIA